MRLLDFHWLPALPSGGEEIRRVAATTTVDWSDLERLAKSRLDFVQTNRVDKILQKRAAASDRADVPLKSLRVAVLSSSTADHLVPGLRVAGLRRGFLVDAYLGNYGQYLQELHDTKSDLYKFRPDAVVLAFDAQHLFGGTDPGLSTQAVEALIESVAQGICGSWRRALLEFKCQVIQQSVIGAYPSLMGSNEHRLGGSIANLVDRLNARLRELADAEGVDMLSLERFTARDGLFAWHDPGLWHRSKQEISPAAAPAYGDLIMRLVCAQRGVASKCLVLDLDNTLWGGVIGDDGLEGIKLGQGSALGEAFVAFQKYALDLSRRGVILAVCSKNDVENARAPFEKHADMVLKSTDIACFVANWSDKATNLRLIAEQLNIGIDSLVFADDNPFERNIVRRELPMVAVPELPEDPALYAQSIADAGYFESLRLTPEDFERNGQYRANAARDSLRSVHTDLGSYLQSLKMVMQWAPFDRLNLQRVVQLINKTNQFNLRTRRYTETEVLAAMDEAGGLTLSLRLLDQFGDNGVISIIVGQRRGADLFLDTWLMSCRVLGRQVEEATLNLIVEEARRLGLSRIIGEYLPTKKNGMVREHYKKLGFSQTNAAEDGSSLWELEVADHRPLETWIATQRSDASG